MPYVPEIFRPNDRVAELLLRQGDIKARGAEQSGNMWANLVGQVGRLGQGYFDDKAERQEQGRIAAAKQAAEAPKRALEMENLNLDVQGKKSKLEEEARSRFEANRLKDAMGAPGASRAAVLKSLEASPDDFKKADEHYTRVDNRMASLLGEAAAGIRSFGDRPEAAIAQLDDLAEQGFDAQKIAALKQQITQDPTHITQLVDSLLVKSPIEEHRKLATPTKKEPGTREIKMRNPDGSETIQIVPDVAGSTFKSAPEPKGSKDPSFQAKDILDDAGKPVVANFDSRSGKYFGPDGVQIKNPRPVPSDRVSQDQNKFKKAAPVLSAIGELSEKINTQSGLLAKMGGGASKLAAKANYDDDVSEYQSLVSGFTPMVARALGHTGVLTQQDVDSVKALFPLPGDSKTLRDRKITRMKNIIGELESGESGGADLAIAQKAGASKKAEDIFAKYDKK